MIATFGLPEDPGIIDDPDRAVRECNRAQRMSQFNELPFIAHAIKLGWTLSNGGRLDGRTYLRHPTRSPAGRRSC